MKRIAMLLLLAGCSSSAPVTTTDAGLPTGPVYGDAAPAEDGGHLDDAGHDAGPLFAVCVPGGDPCPDGLLCFAEHTDPAWWVDMYGHCYAACTATTLNACESLGGACGCPRFTDGGAWPCTDSDRPPGPMACVPGVKP